MEPLQARKLSRKKPRTRCLKINPTPIAYLAAVFHWEIKLPPTLSSCRFSSAARTSAKTARTIELKSVAIIAYDRHRPRTRSRHANEFRESTPGHRPDRTSNPPLLSIARATTTLKASHHHPRHELRRLP